MFVGWKDIGLSAYLLLRCNISDLIIITCIRSSYQMVCFITGTGRLFYCVDTLDVPISCLQREYIELLSCIISSIIILAVHYLLCADCFADYFIWLGVSLFYLIKFGCQVLQIVANHVIISDILVMLSWNMPVTVISHFCQLKSFLINMISSFPLTCGYQQVSVYFRLSILDTFHCNLGKLNLNMLGARLLVIINCIICCVRRTGA